MLVGDIIAEAKAHLIGMEVTDEEMLRYYCEVEKDVAVEYFPLYKEEDFAVIDGGVAYTSFKKSPVAIHAVKNKKGENAAYTLFADYLKTDESHVHIVYGYLPEEKTASSSPEVLPVVPYYTLIAGILRNYYRCHGLYTDADAWGKVFENSMERIAAFNERQRRVYARRWI